MARFVGFVQGGLASAEPLTVTALFRRVPAAPWTTTKDNVQQGFEPMGGLPAFVEWAKKNQTAFYQLYSKLLPHEASGEGGGGVTVVIRKLSDSTEG